MPKKAILSDIDDIVQIRSAFEDFKEFATALGWNREELASWLAMQADKLVQVDE